MRGSSPSFLVLVLVLVLAGCGERPASDALPAWQVDSTAVLSIGEVEGDAMYQLDKVRGIAELPDGTIAVSNSGSGEIRLYDSSGRFVRAIGRIGGGPGEFTLLRNVVARGDTIFAYDGMAGRLTQFLSSGEYVGDRLMRPEGTLMIPVLAGLFTDGSAVGWVDEPGAAVEGFQRWSAVLLRFGGGRVDTLGHFLGDESIIHRRDMGNHIIASSMASWDFYRSFRAVAGGDRIYAGATDSAIIHVWNAAGTPLSPLRWDDAPRPLSDDDVLALVEREDANLEPADREADLKEARTQPHPPTAPVFDRLILSPENELWVHRFDQPGTEESEWLVFGADGALKANVRIPRGREIRAIGPGRVYTIERDEYDVEYVRAYALRR